MNYFISDMDRLKKLLQTIIENRCSLSEEDVKLLNECIELLDILERSPPKKKGKIVSNLAEILIRIFANEDFQNWLDKFM